MVVFPTKVPPMELSFPGTKVLGYKSSVNPSNTQGVIFRENSRNIDDDARYFP